MKIYNRKKFVSGAFCILLGALLLVTSALRHGAVSSWVLALVLIALGAGELARSLSKTWAREDKLEEWDERNRLIDWKAKSRAFQLTQGISFVLMLAMLAMGKVSGYEGFIYIGVGLAFAWSISMFSELFSYLYYEFKN